MATIGDPLADVGYLLMHWTQPGDALGKFNAHNVTLRPGFPTRAELTARYEERSGRPVGTLDWYVTLALWKAVVFMEGNYKRAARRLCRRSLPEDVRRRSGRDRRTRGGRLETWPLTTAATEGC